MATPHLSSNWKRLQEKLRTEKADGASKPKTSKRKAEDGEDIKGDKPPTKKNRIVKATGPSSVVSINRKTTKFRAISVSTSRPKVKMENGTVPRPRTASNSKIDRAPGIPPPVPPPNSKELQPGKYLAIDCEMVGTGPPPNTVSILARVSIVNYHLHVIMDVHVIPTVPVTDYRTHVSGILPHHLTPGAGAIPLKDVKKMVREVLRGRILVGHAVHNDLEVLMLDSEVKRGQLVKGVRDTARYRRFREMAGGRAPALKNLVRDVLGIDMRATKTQELDGTNRNAEDGNGHGGVHDSVEDARMTMELYKKVKEGMDREMSKKDFRMHVVPNRPLPDGVVKSANGTNGIADEEDDGEGSWLDEIDSEDDADEDDEDEDEDNTERIGGTRQTDGQSIQRATKPRPKKKKKGKNKAKKRTKRS